jgi:peptide methionine sulfoxide reductase msrA/msrB
MAIRPIEPMKISRKIFIVSLGACIAIAGVWYAKGYRTIGTVKIPSIPKHGCLEQNKDTRMKKTQEELSKYQRAYFAGGCFWCTESDLQKALGVVEVVSGYSGGHVENPTYGDVTSEKSGHREAVEVYYDDTLTDYEQLVRYHLTHIDPTDDSGQFYDRGESYQAVIFYQNPQERAVADKSLQELSDAKVFDKPLAVRLLPYTNFITAEKYHQDYAAKNTVKYCAYRESSGRDAFLQKYFGGKSWEDLISHPASPRGDLPSGGKDFSRYVKPSDAELRAKLTAIQYDVTQEEGTERPFDNEYNENHADGIYVDIVSGEPLYSSSDKYESGTGWPSFVKPIDQSYIVEKIDKGLFSTRTEIRSRYGDNHLGHVFGDGPADRGGKRYCMNSAALRFIPKEKMEKEGYGYYLPFVISNK